MSCLETQNARCFLGEQDFVKRGWRTFPEATSGQCTYIKWDLDEVQAAAAGEREKKRGGESRRKGGKLGERCIQISGGEMGNKKKKK